MRGGVDALGLLGDLIAVLLVAGGGLVVDAVVGARGADGGRNSIATAALSSLLDHRPIPQSAARHYAWPTTVFSLLLAPCSLSVLHFADIAYAAQQFTQTNRLRLWHIGTR